MNFSLIKNKILEINFLEDYYFEARMLIYKKILIIFY